MIAEIYIFAEQNGMCDGNERKKKMESLKTLTRTIHAEEWMSDKPRNATMRHSGSNDINVEKNLRAHTSCTTTEWILNEQTDRMTECEWIFSMSFCHNLHNSPKIWKAKKTPNNNNNDKQKNDSLPLRPCVSVIHMTPSRWHETQPNERWRYFSLFFSSLNAHDKCTRWCKHNIPFAIFFPPSIDGLLSTPFFHFAFPLPSHRSIFGCRCCGCRSVQISVALHVRKQHWNSCRCVIKLKRRRRWSRKSGERKGWNCVRTRAFWCCRRMKIRQRYVEHSFFLLTHSVIVGGSGSGAGCCCCCSHAWPALNKCYLRIEFFFSFRRLTRGCLNEFDEKELLLVKIVCASIETATASLCGSRVRSHVDAIFSSSHAIYVFAMRTTTAEW